MSGASGKRRVCTVGFGELLDLLAQHLWQLGKFRQPLACSHHRPECCLKRPERDFPGTRLAKFLPGTAEQKGFLQQLLASLVFLDGRDKCGVAVANRLQGFEALQLIGSGTTDDVVGDFRYLHFDPQNMC